jgi:transcription factor STE12
MAQEATTAAVAEPALSFEFDSSQSLYEQLTKAQQANSSSFSAHASTTYGQSTSPVVRTVDAMPPPQMAPSAMPLLPEDPGSSMMYNQVPMPMKREADFAQMQYDRNGMPMARLHQRHASMPSYMEYSPAPSFVSSQYEDYSNRGLSFEPITPPQQAMPLGAEPAYIANEDTGLYTAIPDVGSTAFHPMMQLPPSNLSGTHFAGAARHFPGNVYSVIEGSPSYKQRRRRSSIPPSITHAIAAAQASSAPSQPTTYAAHRPSDLRRSVSNSVAPVTEADESVQPSPSTMLANGYASTGGVPQKDLLHEISRHGTPLHSLDEGVESTLPLLNHSDDLSGLPKYDAVGSAVPPSAFNRPERPGPVRRARSATMMELGPYPQKSHSCPIPSCGRLFKRLEHLKRYV